MDSRDTRPMDYQSEKNLVSLFDIKSGLVFNLTILKLTDLFILYFYIQNIYADKKYFKKG